jgi:LuxR family quorum-sensing transcriptional regulator LasR
MTRGGDGSLLATIFALGACDDEVLFRQTLIHIGAQFGFDSILYGGRFAMDGARVVQKIASNYSPTWRETYDREGFAALDPTVSHAMRSVVPLTWSHAMYTTPEQHQFREDAASHGLVAGASFPVHSREGDVGLLSLALSSTGHDAHEHIRRNLMWGTLIATMAQQAMHQIVKGPSLLSDPQLTPREIEVLKWLAAGKSTWELSVLLTLSEHGVVYHVRNLLKKLDVPSRRQAIAKAIAYGII